MKDLLALALLGALAGLPADARGAETPLPAADEPGESEEDERITQSIRETLDRATDLSAAARNATITTVAGEVTLRGPVETADEKQRLGALAQSTPGVVRIRNELLVKGR